MALDLGISQEDIDTNSPESLEEAVLQLHNAELRRIREDAERAKVKPVEKQVEEEDETIDWGKDEDGKPLSEKDIAPGIVNALKGIHKSSSKKVKELEAKLSKAEEREETREREAVRSKIDNAFEKLGNEAMFGKGSVTSHHNDSPERARRNAALAVAQNMTEGSFEQRLAKAAKLLFGEPTKSEEPKPAYDPLEERRKAWADGGVAKPTNREGAKEPKGLALAKKTFIKEMKAAGLSTDTSEETSELPD